MRILSSLWGRVFSLLLLGVVLSAALTWWLAFGERQKTISQFRDSHVIERAEQLVLALNALPAANREAFLATAPRLGLKVTTLPAVSPNKVPISHYAEAISDRLGKNFRVISLLQDPQSCPRLSGNHNQLLPLPCEALGITLSDGSALRLTIVPPRGPAPPLRPEFIQYLLIFLGSIAIMAFLIARMTMRPLQKMAQAATDLGQDINRPPLPESGAREILQATRAFNAMQARIRQHIAQRTHMLAAITHDLQTPLTRLRLRLEKVGDEDLRHKLIEDLSNMQMMIREGLDLARSMDSNEALTALDLDSLVDSVCTDAVDAGQNVQFEGRPGVIVNARPQALRRCLTNLIDNAVKYGHFAKVSFVMTTQAGKNWVQILVRDGGPGIAPDLLEKVFEPFYRIETSRSRESGGTGLGLTIAQNIAQQNGGNLQLKNLPEGGLEACLSLPVQLS